MLHAEDTTARARRAAWLRTSQGAGPGSRHSLRKQLILGRQHIFLRSGAAVPVCARSQGSRLLGSRGLTFYDRWLARGHNVVFAKDARDHHNPTSQPIKGIGR
jgi:hypothetical protein